MSARGVIAGLSLISILASGCGADDPATSSSPPSEEVPTAITAEQVTALAFDTPKADVVDRLGPPLSQEEIKPEGVVAECYRYRGLDETGRIDPDTEFRLCYDDRGRLSLKSTAPTE